MQQLSFTNHGKVLVRSPLYSYLQLFNAGPDTHDLDTVIARLLEDPLFLEGLYWGSPQLYNTVQEYRKGRLKSSRKDKLLHTLKKYAIRACTRCTPYGIFAGCSLADIGTQQQTSTGVAERKVRIDMGFLQQLIHNIESDPVIWTFLRYSLNSSLHLFPGQYRFTERTLEEGKVQYQVSSIEQTDMVEQVVVFLQEKKRAAMADLFSIKEPDTSVDDFQDFIKELIDSQFLVSELQLGLTLPDEIKQLQNILNPLAERNVTEVIPYTIILSQIEHILQLFHRLPLGTLPVDEIKTLQAQLAEYEIEIAEGHIFHTDLKQATPPLFSFPESHLYELERAITVLGKLSSANSPHERLLSKFKKLFIEKYDTREIPLAEVLDPDFGIGFPATDGIGNVAHNPLIEKIAERTRTHESPVAEKCPDWLRNKLETAIDTGKHIQVYDRDLDNYKDRSKELPNHYALMGTLLPNGNMLLQHVGGAHPNSLLGRFAYLEKGMNDLCTSLADIECTANKDIIFAEIIHIPEGRVGNIARRPSLTGFEILYLASGSVEDAKQLRIDDLLVSVREDEIFLRSKKWNKRVIPRLSNAHNYAASTVPVYKFLAAIQHQGKQGLEINWGTATQGKRYLPRITYRKTILQRANWFLQKSDIETILQAPSPLEKLRAFIEKWQVPQFVCLAHGDNELFIDTRNDSYLYVLLEEIKTLSLAKLVEWLHDSNPADAESRFIRQFILPLSRRKTVALHPGSRLSSARDIPRTFEPGSEWLYFKIYCSSAFSDSILLEVVKPTIDALLLQGVIREAFFIRYADPHYHIRFRLHLATDPVQNQLQTAIDQVYALVKPFSANRTVWKLQVDTYEREVERYGIDEMLASEEAFFYDSQLYLRCLADESFAEDPQKRFLTALKNMDRWLTLFGMNPEEKATFCLEMSDAFAMEFGNDVKLQLDLQFREWKGEILKFLSADDYNELFTWRDQSLNPLALPIENISSYIHMSMNRWFATDQRLMEYMAYLFCGKHYNQLVHQLNVAR